MRATTAPTRRDAAETGFTLIELLVVVLILGVLAAIAIPVWLGQRDSAYVAVVRNDLHNASTAAETFAAANGGYLGLSESALADFGYTPSEGLSVAVAPAADGYVLTATNSNLSSARAWTFSSATGTISG